MRTRAAALAVLMLGVAAPASSAMAFPDAPRRGAYMALETMQPNSPYAARQGFVDIGRDVPCPMSSAAEGNANQQTRPVMQYGQTSGGNRC